MNFNSVRLQLNKNKSSQFWQDHIEVYKKICQHVRRTNRVLGTAILISFITNLYLVCVKLLVSMRYVQFSKKRSFMNVC